MLNKQKGFTRAPAFRNKSGAGFTLFELIVVVAIISLMTALILANYRQGQKEYILDQAAQKLISDIRKAQNMAISGVRIKGQYCGYGIEISPSFPTSYIFYADVPSSGNCNNSNNKYTGSDDVIETVNLPSGVSFESTNVDIFFKPPEPTTYINGDSNPGTSGTITLEMEGVSSSKTIIVNTAGQIQY